MPAEFKRIGDCGDLQEVLDRVWEAQERCKRENPAYYEKWLKEQKEIERQRAIKRLEGGYSIPAVAATAIVDGWDEFGRKLITPPCEVKMRSALACHERLIVVCGLIGTGKTIAACRCLGEQEQGLYIKARSFAAWSAKMREDRWRVDAVIEQPFIVLDELAMEDERDRGKIEELLHERYEQKRITIALANKSPREVLDIYGERVARRVFAKGRRIVADVVLCPGELKRQGKAHQKQGRLF